MNFVSRSRRKKLVNRSLFQSAEIPDLVAGALARRDISGAIRLLELEKERGFRDTNQMFLLIYLYCLNNDVGKAEQLAATNS